MKNIGIALIVAGIILMIITGFNFVTKEKVLDVGSLEITKEKSHPVGWSPFVGAALIAGGIILIIAGKEKKSVL